LASQRLGGKFDEVNSIREQEVRIEPLASDDVERVAALAREIWHDHYPAIISTAQIDYMLQQRYDPAVVRAELGRGDIWWHKLVVGDELRAFSSFLLTDEPGTMKLDKLYVATRHQRRSYGAMLIGRALAEAGRQRCDRLVLAVNKNNASAIAAYLKHGFRIADAVVKEIGGGFVMDDYIMEIGVQGDRP
jgi:ribosomal protein S18 acetylase RimI-like enzyme